MAIHQFISKFLFRASKNHKLKSQANKKNNNDEQLKRKLKANEDVQKKLEERIKLLERKYSLLEKRVEMLEAKGQGEEEPGSEMLPNVISWDIQQPNESIKKTVQDKGNVIQLSIQSGGKLKQAEIGDIVYYKAWEDNGKLYFVFVNSERTLKAINNRTTIIEPFCDNVGSVKSPDSADSIEIVQEGVLSSDFQVLEKVKIKYA